MQYALLLYADVEAAAAATHEEAARELQHYEERTTALAAAGELRGGEAFLPAATATWVWRDDGMTMTGEVPAGTWELSGFYLVECEEERAQEIAASMPVATHGRVEVRPLMELPPPR